MKALRVDFADYDDLSGSPKVPIPGAAGVAISESLRRMAMHAGECGITIKKERVAGGGYVYIIGTNEPPARPVRSNNHG
jgi:hypothetical protein